MIESLASSVVPWFTLDLVLGWLHRFTLKSCTWWFFNDIIVSPFICIWHLVKLIRILPPKACRHLDERIGSLLHSKKRLQHPKFPSGPPRKYWTGQHTLYFTIRNGMWCRRMSMAVINWWTRIKLMLDKTPQIREPQTYSGSNSNAVSTDCFFHVQFGWICRCLLPVAVFTGIDSWSFFTAMSNLLMPYNDHINSCRHIPPIVPNRLVLCPDAAFRLKYPAETQVHVLLAACWKMLTLFQHDMWYCHMTEMQQRPHCPRQFNFVHSETRSVVFWSEDSICTLPLVGRIKWICYLTKNRSDQWKRSAHGWTSCRTFEHSTWEKIRESEIDVKLKQSGSREGKKEKSKLSPTTWK